MKKLFLIALIAWPFIAYSYAQQSQPDETIIVSAEDSQIRVIGNLTENSVLVKMSNDFWPNTLLDIVLIGSGLATMVLVFVLWHQNRQTEISMRLSYGPVIHGRYTRRSGIPRLLIDNVGNGPALDLNLKIKTLDGKQTLDTVRRLALTPEDPTHRTKVNLEQYPEVLFDGTYKDANRKIQKIHHVIKYPLMTTVDEENDTDST